ncbi:putative polyprenol reductase SCDLUD_000348 [Saccharomycodes ludwigii]|uniref:putative polyprenol reductase n=1 Tax=Saccharomycodes ludwigii TaxID=36035 RepID=UPI001E8C9AFD|nr:hypothetical protein SCDLUD_000348 [Saccharomycodes ludwigii]KAH3902759.1 hypothetical protein SCDLUD_000348 [Saccharomycodes ludwigii]
MLTKLTQQSFLQSVEYIVYLSFIFAYFCIFLAEWKIHNLLKYGKTLPKNFQYENNTKIPSFLKIKVYKYWFYHFYLLSSLLSIITIIQSIIAKNTNSIPVVPCLYLIHSLRRLYESLYVAKKSKTSLMNISHYIVGLWFYTSFNFITYVNRNVTNGGLVTYTRIAIFTLFFLFFNLDQYKNHLYLSKLTKYTLPSSGLFKWVCCAHYFDEVMIYLTIFLYAPNPGYFLAFLWVFINLSCSAKEQQSYYYISELKNRKDKHGIKYSKTSTPKYAIIPCLL